MLAAATTAGAIRYSVAEMKLSPSLGAAAAAAWLDAAYEAQFAWIGQLAFDRDAADPRWPGTLGAIVLRRRLLPPWRLVVSLASTRWPPSLVCSASRSAAGAGPARVGVPGPRHRLRRAACIVARTADALGASRARDGSDYALIRQKPPQDRDPG